jgi:hypothetical protein
MTGGGGEIYLYATFQQGYGKPLHRLGDRPLILFAVSRYHAVCTSAGNDPQKIAVVRCRLNECFLSPGQCHRPVSLPLDRMLTPQEVAISRRAIARSCRLLACSLTSLDGMIQATTPAAYAPRTHALLRRFVSKLLDHPSSTYIGLLGRNMIGRAGQRQPLADVVSQGGVSNNIESHVGLHTFFPS